MGMLAFSRKAHAGFATSRQRGYRQAQGEADAGAVRDMVTWMAYGYRYKSLEQTADSSRVRRLTPRGRRTFGSLPGLMPIVYEQPVARLRHYD